MEREQVLPILYEMALVIGGETSLKPLLQRTLQRLLYYTSYPAGFVCLDLPPAGDGGMMEARLEAVVGDYELNELTGQTLSFPVDLLLGNGQREEEATALLSQVDRLAQYRSFLRLPVEGAGVIILLAPVMPESVLPLTQMFQPVVANLAKAIRLCRQNDAHIVAENARREQLEFSLRQSESNFRSLLEFSPIGVGFTRDGRCIDANETFLTLFGYTSVDEFRGRSLLELVAETERPAMRERIRKRMSREVTAEAYETTGLRKDGRLIPLMVSSRRVELPEGPLTFSFFLDLTEAKQREQALQASNEMLRAVLENVPVRIFWKDRELRYLGCNTPFARDAGLNRPEELIGHDDFALGWREQAELYRADDRKVMESGVSKLAYEEPQTAPDGKTIWLRTSKVPLRDADGTVNGVLGLYEDITREKLAEEKIYQLAFMDPLTGLPNRRLLLDRLEHAMVASVRSKKYGALALLDLDRFKTLNDTRGHNVGDKMLVAVARRLQGCVREGDTVSRLGGDEFVVLLENVGDDMAESVAHVGRVVEKIRDAICQPYMLDGFEYHISPSIGVALFLDLHNTLDELMIHADMAMYQAKAVGRNAIRFFDPQMQAALEQRSELENALRHALARDEMRLYYQVQVDAAGLPIGAEALLRWQRSGRGMVSPGDFIPVAEDTGMILPIGEWVLDQACRQLALWQQNPRMEKLSVAVNVSACQFRQEGFVAQVRAAVQRHGINPRRLKLELTESLVLEDVDGSIAKMAELRQLGVHFSIDDFGTGYSSLSYLKRLPLEQIKIDQSFVRDLSTDPNDAAIVETIVVMAHSLGLNVIAEGVETESQRSFLEQCGCNAYQGYLFGRPVPVDELEQKLLGSAY